MTFPPPPQGPTGGPGPQQPGFSNSPGGYPPPYPNQQQPMYSYDQPGVALVQGTGKARAMASVAKSFSLFGRSFGGWILFLLLASVASSTIIGVIGMISGIAFVASVGSPEAAAQTGLPLWMVLLSSLISAAINAVLIVFGANGALRSAEGRQVSLGEFFKLQRGFLNPFITAFIATLLLNVSSITYQVTTSLNPNTDLFAMLAATGNDAEASFNSFDPSAIVAGGVAGLIAFFVAPLLIFAPFYSIDRSIGAGDALSASVSDALRNYFPILGFSIVSSLIMLVSAIPLGLGLLVTIPAYAIGLALIFRQMSGGAHVNLTS